MVRCFVGVILPEELHQSIRKVIDEIKKLPIKCKFVEEQNLHICLSFLGEIKESEIEKIAKSLDSIALVFKPFEVFIEGIKLIPNEKFLRVIALDLRDEKVESLRKMVVKNVNGDSKPSHITLCRVKNLEKKDFVIQSLKKLENIKIGKMRVEKIQLIKSELKREGPIYSVIYESKFIE